VRILSLTVILNKAFLPGFPQAHKVQKNHYHKFKYFNNRINARIMNGLTNLLIFYLKVHGEKKVQACS